MHLSARSFLRPLLLLAGLAAFGCVAATRDDAGDAPENDASGVEEKFASDAATLLAFEWDGELVTTSLASSTSQIKAQLFFTVGHFNGERGVSRLDKVVLTKVTRVAIGGGLYRIRYHAKLPVAWGTKIDFPSSYTLTLPRRIDGAGQASFASKYGPTCNDGEPSDVTTANYWYHYRPYAEGCALAAGDVTVSTATVTVHPGNTFTKFPEYQRVWEDDAFDVVAVFGKFAKGDTTDDDAGIAGYHAFLSAVRDELGVDPTATSSSDETFVTTLDDGRTVTITAVLVDEVQTAPASFVARYSQLVTGADLVLYNGHAGLGANVRALSAMGHFFPAKYQIFFMDGCDTFAYVDDALPQARASLNPDDPSGTKYMDIVTNAMPAYFVNMPSASMALVHALIHREAPQSWNTIFKAVDPSQIAVVNGEEDNVYTPSYDPGPKWGGLRASDAVGKLESRTYATDVLAPGTYAFTLTHDPTVVGGDADLRVRAGAMPAAAPSLVNKCPSYLHNSNEKCTLTLTSAQKVYVTVTGDMTGVRSAYRLNAYQL